MMFVLTFSPRASSSLVENHAKYAARLGYTHIHVDTISISQDNILQTLFKYQYIISFLTSKREGTQVLALNDDAVILSDTTIGELLGQSDWFIARSNNDQDAISGLQIWTNTPNAISQLTAIEKAFRVGKQPELESKVLTPYATRCYSDRSEEFFAVLPAGYTYQPVWAEWPTFAVCLNLLSLGHCPRFVDALCAHVSQCRSTGQPLLTIKRPDVPDDELTIYNPGQPIAFVMLYFGSDAIETFGALAEVNYRRYCERHGYTLYVYRKPPADAEFDATGNWFKPIVLRRILQHHEWTIWVDADTLVADGRIKIEPLLADRSFLAAGDVGTWTFNSGVIGFRNTPANLEFLDVLITKLKYVTDKSSVYASQGDQYYFISEMENLDMIGESDILPFISVNTPWVLRQCDSFIVHYFGMWPELRALMMAYDS